MSSLLVKYVHTMPTFPRVPPHCWINSKYRLLPQYFQTRKAQIIIIYVMYILYSWNSKYGPSWSKIPLHLYRFGSRKQALYFQNKMVAQMLREMFLLQKGDNVWKKRVNGSEQLWIPEGKVSSMISLENNLWLNLTLTWAAEVLPLAMGRFSCPLP